MFGQNRWAQMLYSSQSHHPRITLPNYRVDQTIFSYYGTLNCSRPSEFFGRPMDGWTNGEKDGWTDRGTEGQREGQREGGRDGWTGKQNFSHFYSDEVDQVSRFCLSKIQTAEF